MTALAISSGHGKHIRGASGSPVPPQLDEVDEARRVVDRVFELLDAAGVSIVKFHDDTSHDQNTNLNTIVNWHNKQSRDKDVSVHFNAYDHTAHGTEVLYMTQESWASEVCDAIVEAGYFTNRGAKYNGGLFFLNNTSKPAILLEVCFCDNTADSNLYNQYFEAICKGIAETLAGVKLDEAPPDVPDRPDPPTLPDRPDETQPVRVTVEHPPGVKVKLTKSYNNTGFVEVDIQHPREQQVDTDVREVADTAPEGGVPSNYRDIIATVFQDSSTAYEPFDGISDSEMSVSLPGNVKNADQRNRGVTVWNRANGKSKTGCKIRDKGPWLVDDDVYLLGNERPLAETCAIEGVPLPRGPHEGKIPNGAGIDLSPALADYLGIDGKGKVDWDWVRG